jgi:hypothetical protein
MKTPTTTAFRKGRKAGKQYQYELVRARANPFLWRPAPPRAPYNGPEMRAEWERGFNSTIGPNGKDEPLPRVDEGLEQYP